MSGTPQPVPDQAWFKSSYSGGNATECVEAVFISNGVRIRDSKQPLGPCLAVSTEAWSSFVAHWLS
ncbi:DUF397 domain-containing protein [Streptomyces sp. FXJ1.172]|uniref:DUF397 domain-containing protein n=1 Tax=Streptomyces sp. FXJ1.172 TaxID=710705 RepID=UPI0007D03F0F|nr:DUF397 domain-containing protein [Streptomyces sp. FXJ1.172]WEO97182.1 DUF397 domain-containing protein [Streptomyces sp. FXJ1.172]